MGNFKSDENSRLSLNWNLNREISKLNYRVHTDAIREIDALDKLKIIEYNHDRKGHKNKQGNKNKMRIDKLDSSKGLSKWHRYLNRGRLMVALVALVFLGAGGILKDTFATEN